MMRLFFAIIVALFATSVFAMSPDDVEVNDIHISCVGRCCYLSGKITNDSNEDIFFVKLRVTMYKDMEGEASTDYTYPLAGLESVLPAHSDQEFKTRCLQKSFNNIPYKVKIELLWRDKEDKKYSKTYEEYP